MDVSIIVVNYNTKQLTLDCVNSIIENTVGIQYEIILVDNSSTDGSKEYFSKDKRITYIYSNINNGFGKANNIGARIAKGKYLFFLNSDTLLLNNAINIFYDQYNKVSSKVGFIGCELQDVAGNINGNGGVFPSIRNELSQSFHLPDRKKHQYKNYPYVIDYVLGADMFVRKDIFEEIGGFDENFFMYYEESDLQKRAYEMGYLNYIIDGPQILHLECKSSGNVSLKKLKIVDSSRFLYIKKHCKQYGYLIFRILYSISRLTVLFNRSLTFYERFRYIFFICS